MQLLKFSILACTLHFSLLFLLMIEPPACKCSFSGCVGESSEEKHKVENQVKRAPIDIDMFADQPESEVPDIFAGSPGNGPVIPVGQRRLQDNFDDPEGYYNFQVCIRHSSPPFFGKN
jgi:hypothetical protein